MNLSSNLRDELSNWDLHFQNNAIKLWDIPKIRATFKEVKESNLRGRALSQEPKTRMYLLINTKTFNTEKLFGIRNCRKRNINQTMKQEIWNEDECVVSPERTNGELLKRLMSMYTQKKPVHTIRNLKILEQETKYLGKIPLSPRNKAKSKPSSAQKSKLWISFSPSPIKTHKFVKEEHEKRKQILSKILSDEEINLMKETIQHEYRGF